MVLITCLQQKDFLIFYLCVVSYEVRLLRRNTRKKMTIWTWVYWIGGLHHVFPMVIIDLLGNQHQVCLRPQPTEIWGQTVVVYWCLRIALALVGVVGISVVVEWVSEGDMVEETVVSEVVEAVLRLKAMQLLLRPFLPWQDPRQYAHLLRLQPHIKKSPTKRLSDILLVRRFIRGAAAPKKDEKENDHLDLGVLDRRTAPRFSDGNHRFVGQSASSMSSASTNRDLRTNSSSLLMSTNSSSISGSGGYFSGGGMGVGGRYGRRNSSVRSGRSCASAKSNATALTAVSSLAGSSSICSSASAAAAYKKGKILGDWRHQNYKYMFNYTCMPFSYAYLRINKR